MSLTAFQRYRRIQQVEEMKPENIIKAQEETKAEIPVVEESKEEVKETSNRRRNTRRN